MPSRQDIPTGRDHAITKAELTKLWRCSDREVRAQVAAFRSVASDDGYAILSSSRAPAGYWRSNDPHEIQEFIRETNARICSTRLMLKGAYSVLGAG